MGTGAFSGKQSSWCVKRTHAMLRLILSGYVYHSRNISGHPGILSLKQSSPITGLERPRGFQEVKVPRFRDNGTRLVVGCQPYAPAAFTPRKYSWYLFLLEAESTPGQ